MTGSSSRGEAETHIMRRGNPTKVLTKHMRKAPHIIRVGRLLLATEQKQQLQMKLLHAAKACCSLNKVQSLRSCLCLCSCRQAQRRPALANIEPWLQIQASVGCLPSCLKMVSSSCLLLGAACMIAGASMVQFADTGVVAL